MNIIVAVNNLGGIGFNNTIPWNNKNDMQFFKMMTYGKNVYMGRKTLESLKKPLPNRLNHVLSSGYHNNCILYRHSDTFLEHIENDKDGFVIGGESIYNLVLSSGVIKNIYISRVNNNAECDKFFKLPSESRLITQMVFNDLTIERYML